MTRTELLRPPSFEDSSSKQSVECPSNANPSLRRAAPPAIQKFTTLSLTKPAVSIAWSPDGKYFATGEGLGAQTIKIWSVPDFRLLHVIQKYDGWGGQKIQFTRDSKALITTSVIGYNGNGRNSISYKPMPNAFTLIDVATGTVSHEILGYSNPPRYPLANVSERFDFSSDGKLFFAIFNGDLRHTYVYDTAKWKIKATLPIGWSAITSSLRANEIMLARSKELSSLIKRETEISIFNGISGKLSARLSLFSQNDFDERSITVAAANCMIGLGASAIRMRVMNPAPGEFPWTPVQDPDDAIKIVYPNTNIVIDIPASPPINEMSFSQKNDILAYTDGVNQIGLIEFSGTPLVPTQHMFLNPFTSELMAVDFDPSGSFLAAAGDNSIVVYQLEN